MYKKFLAIFMLALIFLTSCVTDSPAPIHGIPSARTRGVSHVSYDEPATYDPNLPIPIAVLHSTENHNHGIYEPTDGIYLGAWLMPNESKRDFVNKAGRHAVFVHEMHLCEDVPAMWLLHCMAVHAVPLFMIHPPLEDDCETPIGDKITCLAERLSAFNLPMFVAFYPPGHGLIPAEYSVIFRYARAIFLSHAPQIAFVWVAPNVYQTIRNPFFPGSDAVDWVGVPLFSLHNDVCAVETFAAFYQGFQAHHPLMVLPLGVSHFTVAGHSYQISEAAAEISRMYQAMAGFPRVGLVVYGDTFGFIPNIRDDFSITVEPDLMAAYSRAISNGHFIPMLEQSPSHEPRWVRSNFMSYFWEGRMYINVETLRELSIPLPRTTIEIGEGEFADSGNISGIIFTFCDVRNVVLANPM